MLKDLRYAVRALRRWPAFSLTAILSIAPGIGATSSIFSFADGIVVSAAGAEAFRSRYSALEDTRRHIRRDYADFREQSRSFSGLMAYQLASFGFAVNSRDQPQWKAGFLVSGNFFQVRGTEPGLGRGFRPEEDQAAGQDLRPTLPS